MLENNSADLWNIVKSTLKSKNAQNKPLQMWFEPTDLISVEDDTQASRFRLSVPSELHKYWISQNLLDHIHGEIASLYKKPFHVELVVTGGDVPQPQGEEQFTFDQLQGAEPTPTDAAPSVSQNKYRDSLNKDYTFSTFVVGNHNEFAHAASFNIAQNPGAESYNPLFICGPTGMGKTHLLNAVGNHIVETFPHLKVKYVSAERFLNECISSIRRGEMAKFRQRYRHDSEVLLMDDIQILGRGEAVQEEFFHTLNDFFDKKQQVVVASDRMPKDIHGLEDRIRTRLEWGLIADIQMPDIETRVAILKYKAERRRIPIPQDVITYISRISKRSIRELEGNLNKVKMYSDFQNLDITLDLAKKVLAGHAETVSLTVNDLQQLVCDQFKVRLGDMKGKSRSKPLVTARQTAMYLIKKHLDKSLVDIGRAFGGKDHTTVINALRRIEDQLPKDLDLKKEIEELENRIHNITGL